MPQNTETTVPLLDVAHVSIDFLTRRMVIPAVTDFSCTIQAGQAVGLVGESGCGKSTVAFAIMQSLGPNGRVVNGGIYFNGRNLIDLTPLEKRNLYGSDIAMIYQEPMASLNPAMKIKHQLMEIPRTQQKVTQRTAYTLALDMVVNVGLSDPERILNSYPHQLSGGQQQRIVIAMALIANPKLLILDEPTTALDVTIEAGIIDLIRSLVDKRGMSLLFISHNLGLVRQVCDNVCVMYAGEVVEQGTTDEIFHTTRHPYTQALFRAIPLPSTDKNTYPLRAIPGNFPLPYERPKGCRFGPRCDYFVAGECDDVPVPLFLAAKDSARATRCVRFSDIQWQKQQKQNVITTHDQHNNTNTDPPLLNVNGLEKNYKLTGHFGFASQKNNVVKANQMIDFDLHMSETLAIVGESGCGKSTVAKVIMGLEQANGGTVHFKEQSIGNKTVRTRDLDTVQNIQMVFQNPFDTLNPSRTVGQQIMRAIDILGFGQSHKEKHNRMLELLDLVKLPRVFAKRMPHQLSGGQKQRVGIARAFAGQSKIVIADEPVSSLDVSVQAAITELLIDLQRTNKTALLFISHDLSLVRYLSNRVLVMYVGHVVESGTTDQVFSPPYHPYTEALLSAVPIADPAFEKQRIILDGDIPSALNPPRGCPFHTRCHWQHHVQNNRCEHDMPPMQELANGHKIKCHLSRAHLESMNAVIQTKDNAEQSKDNTEQCPQ